MRRRSALALDAEASQRLPQLAPPPSVGDPEVIATPMERDDTTLPPVALRRGLLLYSGVLTAIGSGVAVGLVKAPVSATVTTHPAPSALAVSALPPPTTEPPPPPPPPPPPTTTTPPTTAPPPTWPVHHVTTTTTQARSVSNTSSLAGIWACIRQKESGDNYSENSGNGYYGAYQFDLGTWQSLGYSGRPDQAPPAEQDAAAQKLYSERGFAPWPNSSRECGA